jgi:hypothetical protein
VVFFILSGMRVSSSGYSCEWWENWLSSQLERLFKEMPLEFEDTVTLFA